MKNIVVIAPHPDDETLGCGGTLLKLKQLGSRIHWVIGTRMTEEDGFSAERIASREKEIEGVAAAFGFDSVHQLNLPTTRLDSLEFKNIVGHISSLFSEIRPDLVFVQNRSDIHSDHRILFEAVMSCCKWFRYPSIKKIMMYEVPSETDAIPALPESVFMPNSFSDISGYIDKKVDIMKNYYSSEFGQHPFPRSEMTMRSLAAYRGAQCGVEFAEAFMNLKEMW